MKRIDLSKYNRAYFSYAYGNSDIIKECKRDSFKPRYKEIVRLANIQPFHTVVDYGCGNGDLCFYLDFNYGCRIVGIDHSKDAIKISNEKLQKYRLIKKNPDIKFLLLKDYTVPNFKKIDIVFFCDVIEHIHDRELQFIFKEISHWNRKIKIIIRTDNLLYIRYIFPFIHFLNVLFGKITIRQYRESFNVERIGHINLTTLGTLTKKMGSFGYKLVSLSYPELSVSRIKKQLSVSKKIPLFVYIIFIALYLLRPLSPTFYTIYEKK